jgi:hypothetical protein
VNPFTLRDSDQRRVGQIHGCPSLPRGLAAPLARSRSDLQRDHTGVPPAPETPGARSPAARSRTWTPICCEPVVPRHVPFQGQVERWWAWVDLLRCSTKCTTSSGIGLMAGSGSSFPAPVQASFALRTSWVWLPPYQRILPR